MFRGEAVNMWVLNAFSLVGSISRMPVLRRLAVIALVCFLAMATAGCSIQRRLYYFPRNYSQQRLDAFDAVGTRIESRVDGRSQTSFYIPPKVTPPVGTVPRLWVICSGNSQRALDWFDYVCEAPVDDAGFLLIDYPGYGLSKGRPSRERIIAALDSAWLALADELRVDVEQLDRDVNLMGFSMGAATGLEFATRRPVRRVVLLGPFTSLYDMARLRAPIVAETLLDRYDNRARLDELAARPQAPRILILHGDDDGVVPYRMGKELSERHPAITRFVTFVGVDHSGLPKASREIIYEEFAAVAPRSELVHSLP
jgi:pimeloyl-ACP methyl ester carboxylesterase